jgi:hypothetical protein
LQTSSNEPAQTQDERPGSSNNGRQLGFLMS